MAPILLHFCTLLFATTARAEFGGWTSGGGDGVVCFDPASTQLANRVRAEKGVADELIAKVQSIEPLDLFLAKQNDPTFAPVDIGQNEKASEYIERLVAAFPQVPSLASLVNESKNLLKYRSWDHPLPLELDTIAITAPDAVSLRAKLDALGLNFISVRVFYDDHGNVTELAAYVDPNTQFQVPPHCAIVTLARTYLEIGEAGFYGEISYDKRLWDSPAFSELNKGIMLLHEWIYAQGLKRNQIDSSNTRTAVISLIRKDNRISSDGCAKLLSDMGFTKPPATHIEDHSDNEF